MAPESLRRAIAPVSAALALVLAFAGMTVATSPAAVAAPAPAFDCTEPGFFVQAGGATSTQLYSGSYTSSGASLWTPLGGSVTGSTLYNALAFNPVDEYLYGVVYGTEGTPGNLVKVDRTGAATVVGATSPALGAPTNTLWDSGEFDELGNYYVANGNASTTSIRKITGVAEFAAGTGPAPAASTITLDAPIRVADLAFKDGYLWGAYYGQSSIIYRVNVDPALGAVGAVSSWTVPVLPASSYGSAFTMTNNNLAFVGTNNRMYQIAVTDSTLATPTFELVGSVAAPANSYSDATNCATAQEASLSVTKTGPATVRIGSTIEWTVTVTNNGPGVTSGFVLTDTLPAGLSNVTASSTSSGCVVNAAQTNVTCNGGRLSATPGENTAVITVTATAPSRPGPIVNSARVVGNEDPTPDPATTAETDVVLGTDAGVPATISDPSATTYDSTSVEGGTVDLADGTFTYTPPLGFSGDDRFTYVSNGSTVTVYIVVNPLAADDTVTTPVDTAITVDGQELVDAGTGSGLELTEVSSPVNGSVAIVNGDPVFTPAPGFSGTGSFDHTLTDDDGYTGTGTVTVVVTPTAGAVSASTATNTPVTVPTATLTGASAGSDLEFASVGAPAHGSVALVPGGVMYTPTTAFSGLDTFTYTVRDGEGRTATGTVVVTVSPAAVNDRATTPAETSVTIAVLDNDRGSGLTITDVSNPSSGSVAPHDDGDRVVFTPADGFSGTASFTYELTDGASATSTATVTVTVTPTATGLVASTNANVPVTVASAALGATGTGTGLELVSAGNAANGSVTPVNGNPVFTPTPGFSGTGSFSYTLVDDAGQRVTETVTVTVVPVATDDSRVTEIDTAVTFDVLGNDIGVNRTAAKLTDPAHGEVTLTAGGSATYTPDAGYSGLDSFTYTLSGDGGTDTATVSILVTPHAPDDAAVTDAGHPVTIDVLANDGGSGLTVVAVGPTTAGGTVAFTAGDVTYAPAAGFSGTDTFTYTVEDAQGSTTQATVTVVVRPFVAPTLSRGDAGEPVTIDVSGSGTGTGVVVTSVATPANGTAVLNNDGTITYTPRPGFSGIETIEYTVTDAGGLTVVGTVQVTVLPTAVADSVRTVAGEPVTVRTLANDLGSGLRIVSTTAPGRGAVTVNADGTITYTPAAGFAGSDTFDYTVEDAAGSTVTATVTVLVTPSLQVTGTEPGSLVLAALVLLGLGGMGMLVAYLRRPTVARHRG